MKRKYILKILIKPFKVFANKVYRMADVAFAVSKTYANRAKVKGTNCKEFIPVYIDVEGLNRND